LQNRAVENIAIDGCVKMPFGAPEALLPLKQLVFFVPRRIFFNGFIAAIVTVISLIC